MGEGEPNVAAPGSVDDALLLVDWKRSVGEIYRRARAGGASRDAWQRWCAERDELFSRHPRSPVADPGDFGRLAYFPYDPDARVLAEVHDVTAARLSTTMSGGPAYPLVRIGRAGFTLYGRALSLSIFWIGDLRGGVFVPFGDATNGDATYGGGRYLLDTLKGEDLGMEGGRLVFDFNYATQPVCVHRPEWSCPLPPPENRLEIAIRAGECMP